MPPHRIVLAAAFVLLIAGCATLPQEVRRSESSALTGTESTRLGRAIAPQLAPHPGLSGIHPLARGRDAFAARVLLARAAERSLDIQYYIWHGDTTGQLLFEAIWQAAERGVRVRVLLDDANTGGLDDTIGVLDGHPRIEVRLFNPFANRAFRAADFVTDFSRVNRRMHNKSFTADNQATIVGGRNVGDEYFDAALDVGFADLDVMAVGPVVRAVSEVFDLYWNSASAYPAASLLAAATVEDAARVQERWGVIRQEPDAIRYADAVRQLPFVEQLLRGELALEWAAARVIRDDPAKVLQPRESVDLHMISRLQQALGSPERELDLVSPYFVPGKDGSAGLRELVERGVTVRVLTNSLGATDVGPVHAGYTRYRSELLRGGVRLYELKPTIQRPRPEQDPGPSAFGSSSGASLHAKSFAVDRRRVFVGSFNLDPRSARLNTEMGVVIDSPALASRLSAAFDTAFPLHAYEVRLASDGRTLEWIDRTGGEEKRLTTEPGTGLMRRWWIGFLAMLPIEWML